MVRLVDCGGVVPDRDLMRWAGSLPVTAVVYERGRCSEALDMLSGPARQPDDPSRGHTVSGFDLVGGDSGEIEEFEAYFDDDLCALR